MTARSLPGLGLTGFWEEGTNAWKSGMDANLLKLSVHVNGTVKSRTTSLPGTPTLLDIYIVPDADPNAGQIAVWDGEVGSEDWVYLVPKEGWAFYVEDENINVQFNGSLWVEFAAAGAGGGGGGTGNVYSGAKVSLLADVVDLDATTTQAIALDEVHWDEGGYFDAGTPGRLTVIAGVTKVNVGAFLNLETVGATNYTRLFLRHYNSSDVSQAVVAMTRQEAGSDAREMMASVDVEVVAGDYFVLELFTETDTTVTVEEESFLSIRALDGVAIQAVEGRGGGYAFSGARAGLASALSAQNFSSSAVVALAEEDYDTDGWFDPGTPGTFVVPAGVDMVRVSGTVQVSDVSNSSYLQGHFTLNGSGEFGFQRVELTDSFVGINIGVDMEVSEGDVIAFNLRCQDSSITVQAGPSEFSIHAIAGSLVESAAQASVLTKVGTSEALATNDLNNIVLFDNASPITYTLDDAIGQSGDIITIKQKGAGAVTVAPGLGVLQMRAGLTAVTNGQFSFATLVCEGGGVWGISGDLVTS